MDRLTQIWNRLSSLFRRAEIDRELEEEMSFHVEMKTREHVQAGMPEAEARRAAQRAFGNRTLAEEDSRGAWRFVLLETTVQDVRYGARTLVRNPVFTVAVVLTLALGIGANTGIFTLLDTVVMRRLPVESPQQLLVFGTGSPMGSRRSDDATEKDTTLFSYLLFRDFREHTEVFSDLTAISSFAVNAYLEPDHTSPGAGVEKAEARLVSGNFFEALGVRPALGRSFTPEDNRTPGGHPVVVLSSAFWARRFGRSQDVVGESLHLNGTRYTVLGVTPPGFLGVTVGRSTDLWVPLAMQAQLMRGPSDLDDRNNMWLRLFGRLHEGVTAQLATARTQELFQRLVTQEAGSDLTPEAKETIAKLTLELSPFAKGFSRLRGRYAHPLLVLMTVVGLVLLIACANVGNLLLARVSSRRKEVALRLALGAGRGRLLRQLLTESLLLALIGGTLGLLVARWTVTSIRSLISAGTPVPLDVKLDHRVLIFTMGVTLLTALLAGLAPALRATRVDLQPALKTQNVTPGEPRRGWGLRKTLVVCQVAVSLLLLVGAGLFLRSLDNLRGQELGYRAGGVLLAEVDPQGGGYSEEQLPGLYRDVVERIEALPDVESASLSYFGLMTGSRWLSTASVDGYEPQSDEDTFIEATLVTPGYFESIGAGLLAGRPFDQRDQEGAAKVAVVNETFARHFLPGRSPVGGRLGLEGEESSREIEIVGLVPDLKSHNLWDEAPRLVYFPVTQNVDYLNSLQVRTRRDPAAAAPQVRQVLSEVAPNLPLLGVRTFEEQVERSLRQEKLLSRLTGFFGLLALLLASIGLYGVLAYGVAQRTSEIGIRMALGAPRLRVLWMVLRTAMGWATTGALLGMGAALVAGRLVSSLLFGLDPADPATILVATVVLLLVAALAGYWPARRASRLNPVIALRYE